MPAQEGEKKQVVPPPVLGSARLTMWLLMILPWFACHAVRTSDDAALFFCDLPIAPVQSSCAGSTGLRCSRALRRFALSRRPTGATPLGGALLEGRVQ